MSGMTRGAKVVATRRLCLGLIRTVFRVETPSPRSLGEMVKRSSWNSPRRARLEGRSATGLAGQAFPVSRYCPHLSPLPLLFPATQRATPIHRSDRLFRLGNLTRMGESRKKSKTGRCPPNFPGMGPQLPSHLEQQAGIAVEVTERD